MKSSLLPALTFLLVLSAFTARSQSFEKVSFDASDSTNGYYLAFPPASGSIKGVLVFFCSFRPPESLLPETRLHNVATASNLLTIYASVGNHLLPDPATIDRMNAMLKHLTEKYKTDTSSFVLGGFDMAGTIVLRFTELAYEHPAQFAVCPKAIFAVASTVDLFGLYRTSQRQIKRNFFPPTVGDARIFLDMLTKEEGTIDEHPENYKKLSPFYRDEEAPGNEQFLRQVALRLYYDTDISWQLSTRRNSLYDTNLPDGSELIDRLLLDGNNKAEFVAAKLPGVRSNGMRNASAMSIVDETDCIQWIKRVLRIFDPNNPLAWAAPYTFIIPDGWRMERTTVPGPFSTHFTLRGIEDIRFPPGWGDAKSEEYWSVAYLLWLDGEQKIDAGILQNNLKIYYDDLIAGALIRRNLTLAPGTVFPTQVTIKKITAEADDLETYTGTIHMYDYMGQAPMTLNYLVHIKSCAAKNRVPLFFEISPKPFDHPLWRKLREMKQKFVCEP
jgi:hypothetical protein